MIDPRLKPGWKPSIAQCKKSVEGVYGKIGTHPLSTIAKVRECYKKEMEFYRNLKARRITKKKK